MTEDYPDEPVPQKRRKRSLYEIIKEKRQGKPATQEEIEQLKLEVQKAQLKQQIAQAKSKTPSKIDKLRQFATLLNPPDTILTKSSKKTKNGKKQKDTFAEKLRNASGSNERDYTGLTG